MFKDKMTMFIFSCEKFSDLWDAHIELLEKNWQDRGMDTYIVTDAPHETNYENVSVMSCGENKEFTERLDYALKQIDTEYVFVTLDDYFLINPVSNEKISNLLNMMEKENLDYVRLFKRPKKANGEKMPQYGNVRKIINDSPYSVNLYAGIWRKSFFEKTVTKLRDIWHYEVSLHKTATELNAKCAVSNNKEFVILDVVRKGKILNKANRFFKKYGYYHGDRDVHTKWYELKLNIRTFGARHAPRFIVNLARKLMMKLGYRYFSQED